MYFWDPFQGYAVGSGTPPSWGFPGGGSGTIRAFTDRGCFEDHRWFEFSGQELTAPAFPHPDAGATIWFAYRNNGFAPNGPIFQAWSASLTATPIRVINIKIENDGTLSLYVGGSPDKFFANSGGGTTPFYFDCNTWYYFQINLMVDYEVVGGQNFLRVKCEVISDGQTILGPAQGTSNFYVDTNFPSLDNSMIFVSFSQPNGGGTTGLAEPYGGSLVGFGTIGYPDNLWDLIIDVPGTDYGPLFPTIVITTAHGISTEAEIGGTLDLGAGSDNTGAVTSLIPKAFQYLGDGYDVTFLPITLTAVPFGSPNGSGFMGHATLRPNARRRVNQAVAEVANAPIDSFTRISQLVVENAQAPIDSFVRISQLVIELPFIPTVGGWIVKES